MSTIVPFYYRKQYGFGFEKMLDARRKMYEKD